MFLAISRLFKSNIVRTIASIVAVGTASIGFLSDILDLRGSGEKSASATTVSVNDTAVSTTSIIASTTSTLSSSTDPQVALEQLRASLLARASSGILDECGQHALLLTSTGLKFYEWTNNRWTDFSQNLQVPTLATPTGLLVIDSPNDGISEVLVTFDRLGNSPPSGGIFGVSPGTLGCGTGYTWRYFAGGDGSYSRIASNLRASTNSALTSRGLSDIEPVELEWNDLNEIYSITKDQTTQTTVSVTNSVSPEVVGRFMTAYSQFTSSSFASMLYDVTPGSPAESLVQFLLRGKQINTSAGYGEGSGWQLENNGSTYRILFPGGGTTFDAFTGIDGKITSFDLNGISLSKLVRLDRMPTAVARGCSVSGICVGVRGVQLGIRTTYLLLEVDSSQTSKVVKFIEASLTTSTNSSRHLSGTTPALRKSALTSWSLGFPLSELPWNGNLELTISVGNIQERITLTLPN